MNQGHEGNWGCKIGVLTPATNLTLEEELWSMRVPGTTFATARIAIARAQWRAPEDLRTFVHGVVDSIPAATAQVMQAAPDLLVLGISVSVLWDGRRGNDEVKVRAMADTGLEMVTPVDALVHALQRLGTSRIGVVTPYPELADPKVVEFFKELGVEVVVQRSLRCRSAREIGEVGPAAIHAALADACAPGVQAIVQLGTDLKAGRVGAQAEATLGLPVLCINPTTWWHTLRRIGITAPVPGWGRLLEGAWG
jgi:maleate isomerase